MKLRFEFDPDDFADVSVAGKLFEKLTGNKPKMTAPEMVEPIPPLPELNTADVLPPPVAPLNPLGFTTSNTPAGVELDTAGLPWDARIHAETRGKTQAGEWRIRRGVDRAIVARVEAELRGQTAPVEAPVDVPPPPATAPVEAPADVPPPPVTAPAPTPIQGSPVPQVGALAGSAPVVKTFPELVVYISGRFKAGTLTPQQTVQVANMYGLEAIPGFMQKPELIPEVIAIFEGM